MIDNKSVITVTPFRLPNSPPTPGVQPAGFHIRIPSENMIQAGEYMIPVVATISTGSTNASPEFTGGSDFKNHANSRVI